MLDDRKLDTAAPERPFTLLDQFFIACLWLAYNVQWGAMLAIVLPDQIASIVGPARKEFFNGLIPPIGATVSLLITPVAGALSDRSRSRFGRRRPFLLVGGLVNILFLILLAGFGKGSSSMGLPQMVAPAMAAVWFVLGTLFVRQVRGVR